MSERRFLMLGVVALPALLGCELVAGIEDRSLETCPPGRIDQRTDDFEAAKGII